MRMLFVADLHYALKQFDWLLATAPRYDVVIIGGDLLELGSSLDLDVQIVVMEKYFDRLRQLTHLVVSSGNHDGNARNAGDESVARWLLEAKAARLFVDGDSVDLDGALITVCPWWDGPISRAAVAALLERDAQKPKDRWVWVHHAPPAETPLSWNGRKFIGDEFLTGWIQQYQPDIVLSGHIHNAPFYPEGSWIDRLGKTWIFNPGRQLGPRPTCLSIDLTAMTAEWVSIEREDRRDLGVPALALPGGRP